MATPRKITLGTGLPAHLVDAKHLRVSAHIDFITFRALPSSIRPLGLIPWLKRIAPTGRLKKSSKKGTFTIHDPTRADFQAIIQECPFLEILDFELAVDFLPRGRGVSREELQDHLLKRVYPNRFAGLATSRRHQFSGKGIRPRYSLTLNRERTTAWWKEAHRYFELKVYHKTHDNRQPLAISVVRVEIRANRGGCQRLGIMHAAALPIMFTSLRRMFSRAFTVAKGMQYQPRVTTSRRPKLVEKNRKLNERAVKDLTRYFERYGAMGCVARGLTLVPDAVVGRRVGRALQELTESLRALQFTPAKRKELSAIVREDLARFPPSQR